MSSFPKATRSRLLKLSQRKNRHRISCRHGGFRKLAFYLEVLESRCLLAVIPWSGDIANGTVWTKNDIHLLQGDVRLPAGATLTVEAGAIVKGLSGRGLLIEGKFIADGTAQSPIVFTSYSDDAIGGDTNNDGANSAAFPGDWKGLNLAAGSSASLLNHVQMRYGGLWQDGGAQLIVHSNATINNLTLQQSYYAGLLVQGAQPSVSSVTIQATNGLGIRLNNAKPTLTAVVLSDNMGAAISMDLQSEPVISNVTLTNNQVNGLLLDGGALPVNTIWQNTELVYALSDTVTVPTGKTLTIAAGQVIKSRFSTQQSLVVEGQLMADGTAQAPIVFTSYNDDTIGGDTSNDGAHSAAFPGDWKGLKLAAGSSTSLLNHVQMRYGGAWPDDAQLTIAGETFLGNVSLSDSPAVDLSIDGLGQVFTRDDSLLTVQSAIQGSTTRTAFDLRGRTVFNRLVQGVAELEAMSQDLGSGPLGHIGNVAYGTIELGRGAIVKLVDEADNVAGNYPEAVYVDQLIVRSGATLDLNGIILYADNSLIDGQVINGSVRKSNSFSVSSLPNSRQPVSSSVDRVVFNFLDKMDTTSFSLLSDIVAFTGPLGPIAPTGFAWLDSQQLEVSFPAQTAIGLYSLTIGPNLLNSQGQALDVNKDGISGRIPDDLYTAKFSISAPSIVNYSPSHNGPRTNDALQLAFDRPMDPASFSIAHDIVSFNGPKGKVTPTRSRWINNSTLEISFNGSELGEYSMFVGPNIRDTFGRTLDHDGDFISEDGPADQFIAKFYRYNLLRVTGPLAENTVWSEQSIGKGRVIVVDSTVTIPTGVSLTLGPGTIIKFAKDAGLEVAGNLISLGTPDKPVVLTSLTDDSLAGDTNLDINKTQPNAGDWLGIDMRGGKANLQGTWIQYANIGVKSYDSGGSQVHIEKSRITDGHVGTYNGTAFTEIEVRDTLIARNGHTGIQFLADCRGFFYNVSIIDNGHNPGLVQSVESDIKDASGIRIQGSRLTLENSIVAFNANGFNHWWGDVPQISVSNSLFHNPSGEEILWDSTPGKPDLSQNANILADPLLLDWENRNYQLGDGSPAIDAGLGKAASSSDLLGLPRYDDLRQLNQGIGFPTYVDLGAIERQSDSEAADLTVADVRIVSPLVASAGQNITVQWTVKNAGSLAARRDKWEDTVYLSALPYLNKDAKPVGSPVVHTGGLDAQQSYTSTITTALPADLNGPMYVLVYANSRNEQREPNRLNNVAVAATPIAVDVPLLRLNTPVNDSISGQGQWRYYRLQPPNGQTVLLSLSGEATSGVDLYARHQLPPTPQQFGAVGQVSDQKRQLRLISPTNDTYFVAVYSPSGGQGNFTLTASIPQLGLRDVLPKVVGVGGDATIKLTGDAFSADSQVRLVGPTGNTVAGRVHFDDSTNLSATFNLVGVPLGTYDVVVISNAKTVSLPDVVQLQAGTEPEFVASATIPDSARPGRSTRVQVVYTNKSNRDITSPILLKLKTPDSDVAWRLSSADRWQEGSSFQFFATSSNGPLLVLRPGQTETIEIQMRTPFRQGTFEVELSSVGTPSGASTTTAIDWPSLKAQTRPNWIPEAAWEVVFANLRSQLGNTWGDYVAALGRNYQYLMGLGSQVADVNKLFGFELMSALGRNSVRELTSAVDFALPSPGLGLQFSRSFGSTILDRHISGPLGQGWSTNWQQRIEQSTDGSAKLMVGELPMQFVPGAGGKYVGPNGFDGQLSKLSDGSFELKYVDGQLRRFHQGGLLDYIQDANRNRVTAGYSSGGRLSSLSHSSGASLIFSYNSAGRISKITDWLGTATTYSYDPTNTYLLSVAGPAGTKTYTYDTGNIGATKHALLSVRESNGLRTKFSYDAQGRLTATWLNTDSQLITYAYASPGQLTMTDAAGVKSIYYFNHLGQVAKLQDAQGNYLSYEFDETGKAIRQTDALGRVQQIGWNDYNRMSSFTDALGKRTQWLDGGPLNRPAAMIDARGNQTRYQFDSLGNLTGTIYADGSLEKSAFDTAGNLRQWTNRRGDQGGYEYNSLGQVTKETLSDGTTISYSYDKRFRLASVVEIRGTTRYQYDTADRLIRIDYPQGRWLKYTLDAAGRRTKLEDHSGYIVNYSYDSDSRLSKLTDKNNQLLIEYNYDAGGRLSRENKGNGTYTTYQYDPLGRLTNITNASPSNATLSSVQYAYDAVGRRTGMITQDGTWSYVHDAAGQLTQARFVSANPNLQNQDLEYSYDALGNRTSTELNGQKQTYVANALNQYTTIGTSRLQYDLDGNMVTEVSPGGTQTFVYNSRNQLIQTQTAAGTWQYEYDPFGNRTATIFNGQRTEFLVDPSGLGNVVGVYDSQGNRTTSYVHGSRLAAASTINNQWAYYDFDAQGSTLGVSGGSGNYVNKYAYSPFGESLMASETIANPFQYVGGLGIMNEGNGLHFMRARYYDSSTGKFISQDPVGLHGGDLNFYAYVGNSPIDSVDPTGLSQVHWGAIGIGAGQVALGVAAIAGVAAMAPAAGIGLGVVAVAGTIFAGWQITVGLTNIALGSIGSGPTPLPDSAIEGLATASGLPPRPAKAVGVIGDMLTGRAIAGAPSGLLEALLESLQALKGVHDISALLFGNNVASASPEDKYGPVGYDPPGTALADAKHWIVPGQTINYRIEIWNRPDAEVATQDAVIYDILDPAIYDFNTFEFTRVGFLDWENSVTGGRTLVSRIDAADKMNIAVVVRASFNPQTGRIEWWFTTTDPLTGDYPQDARAGFLPPFNPETKYEIGWMEYRIKMRDDLPSGTRAKNQAFVQFDFLPNPITGIEWGPAPPYGPWVNTIDAAPPTSNVTALPNRVNATQFIVNWTGADDQGGSGISSYDVYVSVNSGPYQLWLDNTQQTSASYTGQDGQSYAFYSVARDHVGHVEAQPSTADASTRIALGSLWRNSPQPLDVTNDNRITASDALTVINYLNGSQPRFLPIANISAPPYLDVDGNERVTATDALLVINYLNERSSSNPGGESESSDNAFDTTQRSSNDTTVNWPIETISNTNLFSQPEHEVNSRWSNFQLLIPSISINNASTWETRLSRLEPNSVIKLATGLSVSAPLQDWVRAIGDTDLISEELIALLANDLEARKTIRGK